jgi:hypothetical protein
MLGNILASECFGGVTFSYTLANIFTAYILPYLTLNQCYIIHLTATKVYCMAC